MNILAFESSCDETAAAIVRDGRDVLSSVVATQIDLHAVYGGVVPEVASRRHAEVIAAVADEALDRAGLTLADMSAVAVTDRPGLIGALLVGVSFAKGAALSAGLPLVPVHHIKAHAAAALLAHPGLEPPLICLVASGGHTSILHIRSRTDMRALGATRDDAAGEALDKVGRALGMPYPGGAYMDAAAARGDATAYALPRVTFDDSLDFSFSGLKTAALSHINNAAQRGQAVSVDDMAASFVAAVTDVLVANLTRAAQLTGMRSVSVAGGVAASGALRRKLERACAESGLTLCLPPLSLCGDNAAMVGAQGYFELLEGNTAGMDLNASATAPLPKDTSMI